MKLDDLNENCIFYYDSQYMNAYVPNCKLQKEFGSCPCERCLLYIPIIGIKKAMNKILRAIRGKNKNGKV